MASIELTEKFVNGLKNYDLTLKDIQEGGWKYCGGNQGRHYNYFKVSCPNEPLPDSEEECICGHKIVENCYITNGEEILILGSCCIKKFIPEDKSGRTCSSCGRIHKNRKTNLCNDCREIYKECKKCGVAHLNKISLCEKCQGNCLDCGKKCKPEYDKCYDCKTKFFHECSKCGKKCDPKYETCYGCKNKSFHKCL